MTYFRQGVFFAAVLLVLPGFTEFVRAADGDLRQVADFIQARDWKRAGEAVDQALEKSPENLRALYWKSGGVAFAGGTNATAVQVP